MLNLHQIIPSRLRRWLSLLWLHEGTPGERARGVAAGVFSGCFPLFGLQTIIGIALARIVRGNSLLAAGGTWISNPITYLPLYWLNYKIGSLIIQKDHPINIRDSFNLQSILNGSWALASKVLLGSTIVGIIMASIAGYITFLLLKTYSNNKK